MQPRRSERSNKGLPPRRFCHQLLVSSTPISSPRDRINATMSDNTSRPTIPPPAFVPIADNLTSARSSYDGRASLMRTTLGDEDEFGGFASDNEREGAVGYSLMSAPQQNPNASTSVRISATPPRATSASMDAYNVMTSSGSYTDAEPSFDRTVKPRSSTTTLLLPPGTLQLQSGNATRADQRPLHELPTPPAVSPGARIEDRPRERDSVLELMRQMMQRMDDARVEAERGRIEAERIRAEERRRIDADRAEDRRQIDDLNRRMQLMMDERSSTGQTHAAPQQEDRRAMPDDVISYVGRQHVPSQRYADIDGYPQGHNVGAHVQRRDERANGQPVFDNRMGATQRRDVRAPQVAASEAHVHAAFGHGDVYGGRMPGSSVYAASIATPPPCAYAHGTTAQIHAALGAPAYGAHVRFDSNAYANTPPHELRKLTDLPPFTGRAEEWPMFIESYRSTPRKHDATAKMPVGRS